MTIAGNIAKIEAQVAASLSKAGRQREDVTVIAVTKQRSIEETEELYRNGCRHFGENRPEGLEEKLAAFPQSDITWHYIGTLQTRKVKRVINRIDYFHALDRDSLAEEINKRADHTVACFVQVNVTGETSKHGVSPADLSGFIQRLAPYPKIKVIGLMTMAPIDASEAELRDCFRSLKKLQEEVADKGLEHAPCTLTSMGMSGDYPIALEEGASFVRIGTAFFEGNGNQGSEEESAHEV